MIVILIVLFLALGLTQPNGYMQSCNLEEQYKQCSHEDHDITPLDFVFEHLLNLESIVNLFEGEHEYVGDDYPHLPFQNPEKSPSFFIEISVTPHFEIKSKRSFGQSRIVYSIPQNDKILSSFQADILRPPIFS